MANINVEPTIIGLILSFVLFVLALVCQFVTLRFLAPQSLCGDEYEYHRMAIGEPSRSPWIRLPFAAAPFWIGHGLSKKRGIYFSRLTSSLLSALSVGLTTWFAFQLAGFGGGLIAGLLVLLSAERAILAIHLWPDIFLGLCFLLFTEILRASYAPMDMALIGIVAALGFLTRVDFTLLAVLGAAFIFAHANSSFLDIALIVGPTLAAAAVMTVYNGKKHGVWAPDTTFRFNVSVAKTEAAHPTATTQELMLKLLSHQNGTILKRHSQHMEWARASIKQVALFVRRFATFTGLETFVHQTLIEANRASYIKTPQGWQRLLTNLNLRIWFSMLFVTFVFLANSIAPEIFVCVLAMTLTQSLVQTRSRYRMSIVPVLAVNIAAAIQNTGFAQLTVASVSLALIAAGIVIFIRPRPEIRFGESSA